MSGPIVDARVEMLAAAPVAEPECAPEQDLDLAAVVVRDSTRWLTSAELRSPRGAVDAALAEREIDGWLA